MATRTTTIGSSVGLHARPAMLFTQAVTASGKSVSIAKEGGAPANGASILAVMGLAIGHGEQVVLESDDEALLDELAAMLATDLDEI